MVTDPALPVRRYSVADKTKLGLWLGFVAGMAIAVGSFLLTWTDPGWTFLLWVAWCFIAVGAVWLALIAVALSTSHLPTLETIERDGETLTGVRSWRVPWVLEWVLDGCFAVIGLTAPVFDLMAGGESLVVSIPAGVYGVWQTVSLVLYGVGAKRVEAVWIGGGRLINDGKGGVASIPLEEIRLVTAGERSLTIVTSRPPDWQLAPRPWRRSVAMEPKMEVITADMGHGAEDLAGWVRSHLG